METADILLEDIPPSQGSYRTYEEWKLDRISSILLLKKSSYRTYEEWKHPEGRRYPYKKYGSYRTYEEWKQGDFCGTQTSEDNSSYRTYEEWKQQREAYKGE